VGFEIICSVVKPFGTVQTGYAEVISVKNVSRNDHGQITATFIKRPCRSITALTEAPNTAGPRVLVSHLTMVL
jgi:hypothetical protein